ncbi:MAG: hypothetical protein OEY23_15010, partial [Acidimicrobiia bacterium]|nr:hypothetical protein [Acidimicrobiia bacterium]
METPTRNHFTCLWCSEQFKRRRPIGRKPHYCSASCRQRAYEARRRQLHRAGFPQPAPPTSTGFPGADLHPRHVPGYGMARRGRIAHAQRPESFPDGRGFLATLCGAWASPTTRTWAQFLATPSEMARPCKTCSRIAAAFP